MEAQARAPGSGRNCASLSVKTGESGQPYVRERIIKNYARLFKSKSARKKAIYKRVICLAGFLVFLQLSVVRAEETSVLVDMEAPEINIIQPIEGEMLTTDRPWLEIEVTDHASGIKEDDILLSIDGVDVTAGAIIEKTDRQAPGVARSLRLRYQPPVALSPGQHRAQIDLCDIVGNRNRLQWSFFIQAAESEISWDAGFTNTLRYSYRPLEKFSDTAVFHSYLQLPGQRFTLQYQTGISDYPGLITEPNLGHFYLYPGQYTFGWQTKDFTLQYGDINLPFSSGLFQFGLGFKGVCIDTSRGGFNQTGRGTIFRGTTASSFGLGFSLIEATGGLYSWQTERRLSQVYLLQMESGRTIRVVGFQDDRGFNQGIFRYELVYAQAEEEDSGWGFCALGGTTFAGVFWDADFVLLQNSYPLFALSPVSSAQGGAYRYTVRGDKLLERQKRISISYAYAADNLDGRAEKTQSNQSLQATLTGNFATDFGWLVGYQGGRRQGYTRTEQQIIKLGINRKKKDSDWNSTLWLSENKSATITRKYQWTIGYSQPFIPAGIRTIAVMRWSHEEKAENGQNNLFEWRVTMEKEWFQDLAKSFFAVAYQTKKTKKPRAEETESKALNFEGTLNMKLGARNVLVFSGKISLWKNNTYFSDYQTDYSFNLDWRTKVF